MKRKKKCKQEFMEVYYDGYYNDRLPEDSEEQLKKEKDKTVVINICGVCFACILIVAVITVLLTAF